MSKELEFFKKIKASILKQFTLGGIYKLDELNKIEKALTPPTADEVCNKLSEEHGEKIFYTNDGYKNGFHTENQFVVMFRNNQIELVNEEYFHHKYKPKTHIILGRFYEGLENG